tara:strand:- start:438 stop:815 length:378 start_codon:yes stop_codon:yes gene_type:complete
MTTELHLQKLKAINESLKNIHKFIGDPYYKINKSVIEINQRVDLNSKKINEYRSLKKSQSKNTEKYVNLGLDISSENFVIINQKQALVDFYIKDIYERIEKIGTAITDQSKILVSVLERLDSLEN